MPSADALEVKVAVVEHPLLHPHVRARMVAAARQAEAAHIAPGGSGKISVTVELDYNGGRPVAARVRVTGEGPRISLGTWVSLAEAAGAGLARRADLTESSDLAHTPRQK